MDEELLEEWNMAKAYFFRVDQILTLCTTAQMKEDYLSWYKALYRLYIEIEPKIKKEDKPKAKDMLNILTKAKNYGLKKQKLIPIQLFVDFELFLRNQLEDKSLLTPKKDLRGL